MEIKNAQDFHYMLISFEITPQNCPEIKNFEDCINDYSNICDCTGEAKIFKLQECEGLYKFIVEYNLDVLKPFLLANHYNDYTFYFNNERIAYFKRD